MDEHIHTFYIAIFVILGGLLVIAMYWLTRCDEIIKEMAQGLVNCANQIQFACGVIADQRARIRALEDEITHLRSKGLTDANIIELPLARPNPDKHGRNLDRPG